MAGEFLGLDKGRLLQEALGSFWSRLFTDKEVVQDYSDGVGEEYGQKYFDLLEVVLSKSLFDIPVFHREKWTLLTFLESNLNKDSSALLKYGDGAVYGQQPSGGEFAEGTLFVYGDVLPGTFALTLPESMVDIQSYVMNRIHDPSVILIKGVDFLVKNGVMLFGSNPFENDKLPIRNIIDETGQTVDRELALWALNSDFDFKFLWMNYGSIIDFFLESTEDYKAFLQAIWSLFFQGPRVSKFISAVNGLLGLPIIREVEEEVVAIFEEPKVTRVVTDYHEYRVRESATLAVNIIPGATLKAFTPLSDAITIVDSVSVPRWWNNRAFIPLPQSILGEDFFDSLIIPRKIVEVPNEIGATFDTGITGEMTAEQQTFFKNFPLPIGLPGWELGTSTVVVDVMEMIMESYFSNHLFLLEVDTSQVLSELISSQFLKIINDALPAYVHFLGIFDKPLTDDYDLSVQVPDFLDSPCRGVADFGNFGDTLASGEPHCDRTFLEGLYDPHTVIAVSSATTSASGGSMAVVGDTVGRLSVGDTIRLTTEETRITGVLHTGVGTSTYYLSPAVTPLTAHSEIDLLLVDFEDVYTVTVVLGGGSGVATFNVTTASGLETILGESFTGFGPAHSVGIFGLSVRFEDASSGTANNAVLTAGDKWTFNARAEYLGGTQPGLIDPACLPAVNIEQETYSSPDDYQDGYWGMWLIGDPVFIGDVDPQTGAVLTIGKAYFIPGMRVYLRSGSCVPFSTYATLLAGP